MYDYLIAHIGDTRFETFRHFTGLKYAISILTEKIIRGNDRERHANLTVRGRPQHELAKSEEVTLTFKFHGPQVACFTTDFSLAAYASNGRQPAGQAFHFFTGDLHQTIPGTNIVDARCLQTREDYWQTNVYPGTWNQLELISARLNLAPVPPLSAGRMFLKKRLTEFNASLKNHAANVAERAVFDALAQSRVGEKFSVLIKG